MVRFRDTDPRPRDVSPAFERQREERDRELEAILTPSHRPPNPEGYAELVDRANRRAADLYPIDPDRTLGEAILARRRAYVAGYVDAALAAGIITP